MIPHTIPHDPESFWTRANESFADLVSRTRPDALPHAGRGEQLAAGGTTVLALVHAEGVPVSYTHLTLPTTSRV